MPFSNLQAKWWEVVNVDWTKMIKLNSLIKGRKVLLTKRMLTSYCLFQGNDYFRQGKYDDAMECYTKGMNADPYNAVLPTNRASTFFRLKK